MQTVAVYSQLLIYELGILGHTWLHVTLLRIRAYVRNITSSLEFYDV
jgi:hypothetical protein